MGLDNGKPSQLTPVARTVVKYFDAQGHIVEPDKASRILTVEFDESGAVICTKVEIDPSKLPLIRF